MNENEYEISRWLEDKAENSLANCKRALDLYVEYIKEKEGREPTAKQLIDEIEEDVKKPAREKGQIERRLKSWHKWLITECKLPKTGKPASENTATSYVGLLMGFYRANGFRIVFRKRFSDLFSRRTKYPKKLLTTEDVERMVDETKSLRDKAIILWLFEGGFDVSTLSSLNYGDVEDQLDEDFMTIKVYREKEKWEYITHVGEFGTRALRAYLRYRVKRGEVFYDYTPLFVKKWTKKLKRKGMSEEEYDRRLQNRRRIRDRQISFLVIDLALRTGLVKKVPKNAMSPVRPHTFRMCFKTLLETAMREVKEPYVEAWMGHMTKYKGAYFKPNELLSLETYKSVYHKALAIRQTKAITEDLEKRISQQEDRMIESSLAIKQIMSQNEEIQKELNQLRVVIPRPYGSMDRRQAVVTRGVLLDIKEMLSKKGVQSQEALRYIDSTLSTINEIIEEAKPLPVPRTS